MVTLNDHVVDDYFDSRCLMSKNGLLLFVILIFIIVFILN